jgi:N-acetylmuramoyl-L-alanine amidase
MNFKLKYISIVVALFSSAIAMAQVPSDYAKGLVPDGLPQLLQGTSVCIDPGHGGYNAANDRRIPFGHNLIYWESLGNFKTANHLYAQLAALGCDVTITRQNNDTDGDPISDPSIADRVAYSELVGADFFQSVHTNAGTLGGSANYTLMLYASLNSSNRKVAEFPEAKRMAEIESVEIPKVVYTTSSKVYADLDFHRDWTYGYGVLNGHSIPAIISESAFHSNYAEAARLHCDMYQEGMAMQMTKSYLRYFYADAPLNFGEIKGIVDYATDEEMNNVTVSAYQGSTLVREVTTDEGYNGYYFMGWMAPGDYTVKFSRNGTEFKTETVTVVKMDDIETKPTTPNVPAKVAFKKVEFTSVGTVNFLWDKLNSDYVGYRIYYTESSNLDNWQLALNESKLTSSITSFSSKTRDFIKSTTASKLYFKIVGVNKNDVEEIEGSDSKVYSAFISNGGIELLVVDGFDRFTGMNSIGAHKLSAMYINSLSTITGVKSISTVDNTAIENGTVDMNSYAGVFWISGEESTVDDTFSITEQAKVKSYLENGGHFIVSGAEIGWDLVKKGSVADKAFYTDYLKAVYKNDGSATVGNSIGVTGSVFDGVSVSFNNANGWEVKFPDGINPVSGAEVLMSYASGGDDSAIGYNGTFGSGSVEGGIVYFAFPIGATVQADADELIKKSVTYLEIDGLELANDDYFKNDLAVYPNPLKDNLIISGFERNQKFGVVIYSTSGRVVYSQELISNGDEVSINSSNWNKGIYILEIRHNNSKVVKKLLKQ